MDYLVVSELYHHGIKGQQWGKKNGPPYPLDYEEHTAKEKKENPKSTIDNESKPKMSPETKKKVIIASAAVAATVAIATAWYMGKKKGAAKINQANATKRSASASKAAATRKANAEYAKANGLTKINGYAKTVKQDSKVPNNLSVTNFIGKYGKTVLSRPKG